MVQQIGSPPAAFFSHPFVFVNLAGGPEGDNVAKIGLANGIDGEARLAKARTLINAFALRMSEIDDRMTMIIVTTVLRCSLGWRDYKVRIMFPGPPQYRPVGLYFRPIDTLNRSLMEEGHLLAFKVPLGQQQMKSHCPGVPLGERQASVRYGAFNCSRNSKSKVSRVATNLPVRGASMYQSNPHLVPSRPSSPSSIAPGLIAAAQSDKWRPAARHTCSCLLRLRMCDPRAFAVWIATGPRTSMLPSMRPTEGRAVAIFASPAR